MLTIKLLFGFLRLYFHDVSNNQATVSVVIIYYLKNLHHNLVHNELALIHMQLIYAAVPQGQNA